MRSGIISTGLSGRGKITLSFAVGIPIEPPVTPLGVNAFAGDSRVTISWSPVTGSTSYHVKRSNVSTGPFTVTIASPTSEVFVDTSAANGNTYYYVVSAANATGESANSAIVSGTPAFVDVGGPIVISAAGDSITIGGHGFGTPFDLVPAQLSAALGGRTVTMGYNAGHNGYAISYYMDASQDALRHADTAAMVAAGTTHCQLMFGANDQRYDIMTPKETYWSCLAAYMAELNAAGIVAVLHYPTYVTPGSNSNAFSQAGATLMESYIPGMAALCNGTTRLLGDVTSYVNFRSHPEMTWTGSNDNSGLFPTTVVTENPGIQGLATGWVMGWVFALRTPVTLTDPINNDGSMNVSAWRTHFDSWAVEAWSQRMGPRSSVTDGSLTSIHTAPVAYGNRIYDFWGTGVGPYAIDGSIEAVPHFHDIGEMGVPGQINPRNYGPPNVPLAPTLGNFHFGLPPGGALYPIPGYPDNICLQQNEFGAQWWLQQTGTRGDPASGYWVRFGAGDFDSDMANFRHITPNGIQLCGIDQAQTTANYNLCKSFIPVRIEGGMNYESNPGSAYQLYAAAYRRGDPYGDPVAPAGTQLGYPPKYPISIERAPFENCYEPLVIDRDGVMTTLPGPTSRPFEYFPVPCYKFPAGERPYKLAYSTMAEFVAVLVQDLNRNVSKVVVFALAAEVQKNSRHSPIYTGLANEGGITKIVRVGEFDTTCKFPTAIEFACDSQLPEAPEVYGDYLNDQGRRDGIRNGTAERSEICTNARNGFIAISSELENKLEAWDISPYLDFVFQTYMAHDNTAWAATIADMNAGLFPTPFTGAGARTDLAPTLINTWTIAAPTCLLASGCLVLNHTGENYADHDKLLVGSRSGRITVLNTSKYMDRFSFRAPYDTFPMDIWGHFQVGSEGSNITDIIWNKIDIDGYDRVASTGVMLANSTPNRWLNLIYVCCRADRKVYAVCTRYDVTVNPGHPVTEQTELGVVYRTIQDPRIKDPVGISLATRAAVLHIADYYGQQIHAIQIGGCGFSAITDSSRGGAVVYPGADYRPNPDDLTQELAYTGSMIMGGFPIETTENNIT